MTIAGCKIGKWQTKKDLDKDTEWAFRTLQEWNPAILDNGQFVDCHTGKTINRNHLKCMLRRDYIEKNGRVTGKRLERFLDSFLDSMTEAVRRLIHDKDLRDGADVTMIDVDTQSL